MVKLYKIKFLKDYEKYKIGDIVSASKKSAESAINCGFAEYVEEPKKIKKKSKQKKKEPLWVKKAKKDMKELDKEYEKELKKPDVSISKEDYERLVAQGKREEIDRLIDYKISEFAKERKRKGTICVLKEYATVENNEIIEDDRKVIEEKTNPCALREDFLELIALKQRGAATELIVNEIRRLKKIYTIRSDEASEVWIYNDGVYIPEGKSFIREFTRDLLGNVYTPNYCNEIIAKIEADTYINSDKFFSNNNLDEIVVKNGILHLFNKTLRPYTDQEIFFNKVPVTYDTSKECPTINEHFKAVLKNENDVPVMEELIGYLLHKEYKIEKAFMFSGEGRNGKGKTLELMKRFIGVDNCSSVPLQQLESDIFSLKELCNKMANLCGDIDKKALKHTGQFKNLTGRDMISAARKFLSRLHFTNYAKLVFCANSIPISFDTSAAFWNRWVILEFPYTFLSKKEYDKLKGRKKKGNKIADTEIIDKITNDDELSGLLNVALDGLSRLLKKGDFSYSKSVEEVKDMWIRKSDSFAAFLMDCVIEDFEGKITKHELRKAYSLYCKKHKLKMSTDKTIKDVLTSTFGVSEERYRDEGQQVTYWDGIIFKSGKVSEGGKGFSSYIGNFKVPIGRKKHTKHTTHTKSNSPQEIIEGSEELNEHLDVTEEKIEEES